MTNMTTHTVDSLMALAEDLAEAHADSCSVLTRQNAERFEMAERALRTALEEALAQRWLPIETAPKDVPVILANFTAACLLTGSPHVWAAMYVTRWSDLDGNPFDAKPRWNEASHAAMNENGEATHWAPLPEPPKEPL